MATQVSDKSSLNGRDLVAMSAANSGSCRSVGTRYEDKFASTLLGRQLESDFKQLLDAALNECREYEDILPSHEEITRAHLEASRYWNSVPEPRVVPSINGLGQIILTIFFSNGARTSVVV